ncbi:hypothetical protein CCP3SC15_4860001 [Gammaproteobacteria bacterium]
MTASTTYQYNGHSYLLSDYGSWTEAQTQAQAMGGNLVTINNQAEQNWLLSTFGGSEHFWIGYTDSQVEGVWRWINGEVSTYTNRHYRKPLLSSVKHY